MNVHFEESFRKEKEERDMGILSDVLMDKLASIKCNIQQPAFAGIETGAMSGLYSDEKSHTGIGDCDCAVGECDCDGSIWS